MLFVLFCLLSCVSRPNGKQNAARSPAKQRLGLALLVFPGGDKNLKTSSEIRRRRVETRETENRIKIGPRTPPGVQTHQIFALGAAVATMGPPRRPTTSVSNGPPLTNLEPRRSNVVARPPPAAPPPSGTAPAAAAAGRPTPGAPDAGAKRRAEEGPCPDRCACGGDAGREQQGLPTSRFALREARITSRSRAAPPPPPPLPPPKGNGMGMGSMT